MQFEFVETGSAWRQPVTEPRLELLLTTGGCWKRCAHDPPAGGYSTITSFTASGEDKNLPVSTINYTKNQ
ncbi:MAG TPA: hypothetical protein VMT86_10985 [Bryobacteraceae bacterium]|nr:hypothetical protein [Bryobacteraceae bacterium]